MLTVAMVLAVELAAEEMDVVEEASNANWYLYGIKLGQKMHSMQTKTYFEYSGYANTRLSKADFVFNGISSSTTLHLFLCI